jgi:hypothetical protein
MTPAPHVILRLWAAGPDENWYGLVSLEYSYDQTQAKRVVRWALGYYGLSPKTSREYAELRQQIRKGDVWWEQLM